MTEAQPNRRHLLKRAGAVGALAALLNSASTLAKPTTDAVGLGRQSTSSGLFSLNQALLPGENGRLRAIRDV